jgi:transcriptional regulator with XRE-family HTH domain
MDVTRFGLGIRAVRRKRGMTQAQLAAKAKVSQSAVSRAERDPLTLTVRVLWRVADALGARASLRLSWQGEDLDRLLDAAHAGLVEEVIRLLLAAGWEAHPEVTFNEFGERGSIDILAFHPSFGALLIVEVKSTVPDMQATLAGIDRKVRVAPKLATGRGWPVRTVARVLVLPDDRTSRRRLSQHAATVDAVMPAGTRATRRWLRRPEPALSGGVLFLPAPSGRVAEPAWARLVRGNRTSSDEGMEWRIGRDEHPCSWQLAARRPEIGPTAPLDSGECHPQLCLPAWLLGSLPVSLTWLPSVVPAGRRDRPAGVT